MNGMIDALARRLRESAARRNTLRCLIGFDGYVDEIVRAVQSSPASDEYVFFRTISEFADHIKSASGKSADIRVVPQETRIGGNGPIMANAVARLGVAVTYIGALGVPEIHPVFRGLPANCTALGIAEPGHTDAFEFNDGKVMFGNSSSFEEICWESLKRRVGLDSLMRYVRESDLIGVVNWSALHHTDSIFEGLLNEVLPLIGSPSRQAKLLLVDLADSSARSERDFSRLLDLLRALAKHVRLVLCLNEKEARILNERSLGGSADASFRQICSAIYDALTPHAVQIHALKRAVGRDAEGLREISGTYSENPKVSTGGGDNFNGGFSLGLLLGATLEESLIMGNAAAAYYVINGQSAAIEELIPFIIDRAEQGDYRNE